MARIVIALGGNALGNTPAEQRERVAAACPALVGLIHQGHEIIISHGNGPQVGMIQAAFDTAAKTNPKVAPMPLPECTAMSQGYIGYHLQQGMRRTLRASGMPWQVATVVTQVVVDPDDPAFDEPTKPIGAFYDEAVAQQMMRDDPSLRMKEDSGRGWRRVVASPKPVDIAERRSILNLLDSEYIVIACGGGGVPVVRDAHGDYYGVDAVIDKDFASACLAEAVGADYLFILTAVDHVCLNFGTPEQRELDELHVDEAETYLRAGQFGAGSMQPKVAAAVQFVRSGWRRRAVIASLEQAPAAMRGESGTRIVPKRTKHPRVPSAESAGCFSAGQLQNRHLDKGARELLHHLILRLRLAVLDPDGQHADHGRGDDGDEIVKPRGIVRHRLQRLDQAGAAAQTVEQNVRPVDLYERLEHRTVVEPVLKHSLGQAAAPLGRQDVVLGEHGVKSTVAQQRQHVLEAVEVAVKRRAAHRRCVLHVRDRDARKGFFLHAGQKPCANELRGRLRAFVVLDVVHFGLRRSIFYGTIVSQKGLMYNRDHQNSRECFT